MSAPALHADAREWLGWTTTATGDQLEEVRAEKWEIVKAGNDLRSQIQAEFVIEVIDNQLTERWETANA
jgi:hypothetical protein